jgi:putative transposase
MGVSRQAHAQMIKRQAERACVEMVICAHVSEIRRYHPRMGCRKLHHLLAARLEAEGISIGRDRMFAILKKHGLLVEPRPRRRRTTWAGEWRCENLLEEAQITGPNQAWVADITYLESDEGYSYLTLLTDVYSRYIVGFDLSTSLTFEGAERALMQALKAQKCIPKGLIHHSDRGVQYTCRNYRRLLKKYGLHSSMGQTGNCYDNALAERINGILKLEYGLESRFATLAQAQQAVIEAIWLYNHERPHYSLDMQIPYEQHQHLLRRRRPQAKSSIFRAQGALGLSVGWAA